MTALMWAGLASLIWGVVPLLEKTGLLNTKPMVGLFYRCLGVIVGIIILGVFMVKPQEIRSVDAKSAFLLMLSGFLASFVAQMCFYNGLKLGEISRVVPISASYPFITFILGILVLGESWSMVKLGGVFLIVAGVWFLKVG